MFVFLYLIFKRVLCLLWIIFWIIVFYQICLLQIFSLCLWLVFQCSWQGLSQSRSFFFFILMKSGLSMISFMGYDFDVVSKKALPFQRSCRFSPMLSYGNLVLHFASRSIIHFELIFVKGASSVFRLFFSFFAQWMSSC